MATASTPGFVIGAHSATARLDATGALTLTLDHQPAVTASQHVLITTMPGDGLDIGSDENGAVGPYPAPNKFTGSIEVITIELDPK